MVLKLKIAGDSALRYQLKDTPWTDMFQNFLFIMMQCAARCVSHLVAPSNTAAHALALEMIEVGRHFSALFRNGFEHTICVTASLLQLNGNQLLYPKSTLGC